MINMIMYSEYDMNAYEKMLERGIGPFSVISHELVLSDLHIDVVYIPPTAARNYYTLITMGMGAYRMPVPVPYGRINRAEIAIKVPCDWNVESNGEKWAWPISMIRALARMPYNKHTWFGFCHDIDFGGAYTDEAKFCGVLLTFFDETIEPLTLQCGDQVILYQVIPLLRSEIEYKISHGAEALLSRMPQSMIIGPIDPARSSIV